MTDEQINQRIAEACGWTGGVERHVQNLPLMKAPSNYCNDLNAMYEAEQQMDEIDWVFFMTELAGLVRLPKQAEVQIKQFVHSTARHRAEAFLRALGKWEEVQG